MSAVAPAVVAAYNDYARRELGVVTELKYEMYVHPGSMGKFSEHLKTFLDENSN